MNDRGCSIHGLASCDKRIPSVDLDLDGVRGMDTVSFIITSCFIYVSLAPQ